MKDKFVLKSPQIIALSTVMVLCNANGAILMDSFASGVGAGGSGDKTLIGGFDGSGSSKLVVVLGGEHGFGGNTGGNFNSVRLGTTALVQAAQEGSSFPTAAIFYLDNPGSGDLIVNQANHNGSIYGVYLLSGTAAGIGNTATDTDGSFELTTTAADSWVIGGHHNSGPNGGNGAGNATADSPLTEDTPYLTAGGGRAWSSLSTAHAEVSSPSTATYSWTIDDPNDVIATAGVEILAIPVVVPEPSSVTLLGLTGLALTLRRRR